MEAELRSRGHDTVAPDLPCDDDAAGLPEYADAVVDAIGDRTGLVVVAQSFGGFTAPLVCDRVDVDLLALVAAMIPAPGEAPNDYWANTRYEGEVLERYDDEIALFYQDVPRELAAEALSRRKARSEARMHEPSPMPALAAEAFELLEDVSSLVGSSSGRRSHLSRMPVSAARASLGRHRPRGTGRVDAGVGAGRRGRRDQQGPSSLLEQPGLGRARVSVYRKARELGWELELVSTARKTCEYTVSRAGGSSRAVRPADTYRVRGRKELEALLAALEEGRPTDRWWR